MDHYDIIIIGTGAGGGTLLHALAPTGKRILVVERGSFLPQEKDGQPEYDPSLELWESLMEEKFFFQYHMHCDSSMRMPVNERKWMIERFIQQKERENQAIQAARSKAKKGK